MFLCLQMFFQLAVNILKLNTVLSWEGSQRKLLSNVAATMVLKQEQTA